MANTLTAPKWVQDTWPAPNYENPDTKGKSLEYVSIACSAFGTVVVLLRCYSRIYLTKAFGLDDALIIVALLSCIALAVLLTFGIQQWYLGYHIWDLPAESVVDHRKGMWIASFINIWSSSCIRISILLFYRRLSISFSRGFLIATWLGIGYNICIVIGFFITNAFICWPTQSFWMRYDLDWRISHDWKCGNEGIGLPTSGISTVVGDIYCTILPLALVVTLKIPRKQKLALYLLFGLGFLACGAAIARVAYLCMTVWRSWDFTWVIYDMWIWNDVELFVGIFVASAPSLKPLMRKIMGANFLGYDYTNGSRYSGAYGHPENNISSNPQGTVMSTSGSKQWSVPGGEWKGHTSTTVTSIINDEERQVGSRRTSLFRSASLLSTPSSIDKDEASVESFPARRHKHSRTMTAGSPIPEEGSFQHLSQDVEVDPPIYPVAALLRPKSNRVSQLIGDGLPSAQEKPATRAVQYPAPRETPQDSFTGISESSPVPMSNLYLSNNGWVELKPVKKISNRESAESLPGSVKAARLRAKAQNESRILQPSPAGSQATTKPYHDAESSHDVAFVPTPLPKAGHSSTRPSDDMTRLDYSDSSGNQSTTDLNQFQFELNNNGSSNVTALPQHRKR